MKMRVSWFAGALAALALGGASVRATVVVDRPIPELAGKADLVVRGKVSAQRVQWDEEHRYIVTRTFIEPIEALKGASGRTVIVRQVGGSLDGMNLAVQGMARFVVGEDVVVFLEKHPAAAGEFVLESMGASKFSVIPSEKGTMVERSLGGLTLATPGTDGVMRPAGKAPVTENAMPYAELVRQVKAGDKAPALPPPGNLGR